MKGFAFAALTSILMTLSVYAQNNTKAGAGGGLSGVWQSVDQNGYATVLKLSADGTGEYSGEPITYRLAGSRLKMQSSGTTVEYGVAQKGKQLTLSGGDLEAPLIFTRTGASAQTTAAETGANVPAQSVVGTWYAPGQVLIFAPDGTMKLNGIRMSWTVAGNMVFIQAPDSATGYPFEVADNSLTITVDNRPIIYSRTPAGASGTQGAQIAAELTGEWCRTNVKPQEGSGAKSARCIRIDADGTYTYVPDGAASLSGNPSRKQKFDKGTWRFDGEVLLLASEFDAFQIQKLQKENHPRTGKPMLIIAGESFVTAIEKAPW